MRRQLLALAVPLLAMTLTAASSTGGSRHLASASQSARLDGRAAIALAEDDGLAAVPEGVDPQSWVLPEWMGYEDYVPIPGVDWNDDNLQAVKPIRAALILGDFQDRDFVVTQEPGSEHFCLPVDPETKIFDPARGPVPDQDPTRFPVECNPFIDEPITREAVGEFYANFYFNEPSVANHFHTGNEFWLENSWGLIGVDSEAFGPYRMEGKEHEYGLGGGDAGGGGGACPQGDTCGKDFDTELAEASLADVTLAQVTNGEDYDFRYLMHAAYDESGTWQQFGEILFEEPEEVTDIFGPPDAADRPDDENSAGTRYVPWTSFAAAEGIWSHATPGVMSTQGESDGGGVYAHELSHIFGVLDNYNNPFGTPTRRSYTGLWANLSRGSFGGPGGHHNRWQIPPTLGASMPSHHMLRNKIRLGFFANRPNELLTLEAASLAATGPQFGTIYPRAYPLFPTTEDQGLHGIQVLMARDQSPSCSTSTQYDCDGGGYNAYTIEFVDRIGFDSYTPDHGILLAKVKNGTDLAPFMWMIDSHPDDINDATPPPPNQDRTIIDFYRPESKEESAVSLGDARQLADGLFHAGTSEGVVAEHLDEANGLHFYILDFTRDERGVANYRVAVRSTLGAGPLPRGVAAEANGGHSAAAGKVGVVTCNVTNTAVGATDLVRVAAEGPQGWDVTTDYTVLEVPGGATLEVPVYFTVPLGTAAGDYGLALVATSETDTSASATCAADAVVTAAGAPPVIVEPTPTPDPVTSAPPVTPVTGGGMVVSAMLAAAGALGLSRRGRAG